MIIIARDKTNPISKENRAWANLEPLLAPETPLFVQNASLRYERKMSKEVKLTIKNCFKCLLPVGFEGYVTPCFVWESLRHLKLERNITATYP